MSDMVVSTDPSKAFERAWHDAMQDSFENSPFASVGGLDKRASDDLLEVPEYIAPHCRQAYLEGYKAACEEMFGEDWRTCPFGWVPVLEISGTGEDTKALQDFSFPYLRRVLACECGFSAIQEGAGASTFRCDHCGKIRTLPKPEGS